MLGILKTRTFIMLSISLSAVVSLPQLQPQRSIQLGGTGPRPVLLGTSPQPGPNYSQQLTFGGPQQVQVPQQQLFQNNQSPKPIVLQRGRVALSSPGSPQYVQQAPIGTFPIPPNRGQQQIVYRSPVVSTTPAGDDEYDDEEYPDEQAFPAAKPQAQVQTTARPEQRLTLRQPVTQSSFLTNQPQRFSLPQPQPQQPLPQVQPAQQSRTRQRTPPLVQSQPQLIQIQQPVNLVSQQGRLGQDSRLIASQGQLNDRQTTPAPIQTLNRFMHQNADGSITWGYENEDGSFKEETLGADCVVRGKYGYVDPDGVKREYEYQSGNPCDPNKKNADEEEIDEVDDVVGQQRLGGILSARPIQLQQRRQ